MARNKLSFSTKVSAEYRKLLTICRKSEQQFDQRQIRAAFILACEYSKDQKGQSNEKLLLYSLKVAQTVADYIELGTISITASLLFRFAEEKALSEKQLNEECKTATAAIIKDLVSIRSFFNSDIEDNGENMRKLLLTSVSDIRVVLIRMAELLFLLSENEIKNKEQRLLLAKEAMYLYAPIGHRLGLYKLKSELEDYAFRNLNPSIYSGIEKKLKDSATQRNKLIREFTSPIIEQLDTNKFDYEIKSRTKSVYSIWNKMQKQKVDFDEVYDIFAIRIIIKSNLKEEKTNCWKVFSFVTNLYQSEPSRMRDWLTMPKSDTGYESLHTTVLEPGGKWIEVQIRSERMDLIAEKGLAAHWKYKGQKSQSGFDEWLNKMRDALEKPEAVHELERLKEERFNNEIFVFTPKGELRKLKRGSTILDFAYDIHSKVGDTCIGARVNDKAVPIRYLLNNGDRVEIMTGKNQKPKVDWLEFVISSKAQTKIRQALNEEQIAKAESGKEIFKRRLRNWKVPFNDLLVNRIIEYLKIKTSLDFYSQIADEKINVTDLKSIIVSKPVDESKPAERIKDASIDKIVSSIARKNDDTLVIGDKVKNVEYKLARCCNPIFGDDIYGFVTVRDGIKIHRTSCSNAKRMLALYGYRQIKAEWAGYESNTLFKAGIKVKGRDEVGIISKITDVVAKDMKVNMQSISIDTKSGYFEGTLHLFVKDVIHLETLSNMLMKVKGVESIVRIEVDE